MSRLPNTLDGLVRLGIREALFGARTIVPARVEKWSPGDQTIDALPLLKRVRVIDGERLVDEYPIITRVPVQFLRWGGFVIRCPIAVGDIVTLAVSDRQLERWLAGDGEVAEPRGTSTHELEDAIATPGFSLWSDPLPNLDDGDLVIGREGGEGQIRIHADGTIELGATDATKRGVARLNDETTSDASTDAAFWQWLTAADVALRALAGLAAPPLAPVATIGSTFQSTAGVLPTSQVGQITSASDETSTE